MVLYSHVIIVIKMPTPLPSLEQQFGNEVNAHLKIRTMGKNNKSIAYFIFHNVYILGLYLIVFSKCFLINTNQKHGSDLL